MSKLFEHEADKLVFKHLARDLANVKCNETDRYDHFSCTFYLIPNKFSLKMQSSKILKYSFSFSGFL